MQTTGYCMKEYLLILRSFALDCSTLFPQFYDLVEKTTIYYYKLSSRSSTNTTSATEHSHAIALNYPSRVMVLMVGIASPVWVLLASLLFINLQLTVLVLLCAAFHSHARHR